MPIFAMFIRIFLLIILLQYAQPARILVIPASPYASHVKSMLPFAENLVQHDHRVTLLQFAKYDRERVKPASDTKVQYRNIWVPLKPNDPPESSLLSSAAILWKKPKFGGLQFIVPWYLITDFCKSVLDNHDAKRNLYDLANEDWDLVIVDDIFSPCGRIAAVEIKKSSNASIINFGTTILLQSQKSRGGPLHRAVHPNAVTSEGIFDHRNFMHRLKNTLDTGIFHWVLVTIDYMVPYLLQLPRSPATVPSKFAAHSDLLMASLSPFLEFNKPMVRDIIELDVDCPVVSNLPEKYRDFVEDPESKGTIVFAMGHQADWDSAPSVIIHSYLKAFENLSDYRIVWQYVTKMTHPNVSNHVFLDNWIPQASLLYHPNTKLFISHVGGKSFREAICAGVPVVAMPLFAEQYRNTVIATRKRIGVYLDKTDLSPHTVYQAITQILGNTMYARNMQKLRDQMADQIMQPMELGRFWCEFLIKHKSIDAQKYMHLKYALESGNSDVIITCIIVVLTMLYLII